MTRLYFLFHPRCWHLPLAFGWEKDMVEVAALCFTIGWWRR